MKKQVILSSLILSFSVAAFGVEINEGDRVNSGDLVGTAAEVFNNGNVKVRFDGYSGFTVVKAKQLGVGVECNKKLFSKKICVQNRVNTGDLTGTASEVFSNGNVKVSFDGYSSYTVVKAKGLGVGVECTKKLFSKKVCVHDRINTGDYSGTAIEVFNNGNVKVSFDGYSGYTIAKSRELGRSDND